MDPKKDAVQLKKEFVGLFQYIKRVRQEIAAISRPVDEERGFENMGDQLDAIVEATEVATNTIMEAVERNEEAVEKLRSVIGDPAQIALIDKIIDNGNAIFEACSFQDITGQRVSKVVKSVTYVEQRVDALIEIWGRAELEKVEVEARPEDEKTEDEKLLHGPPLDKEKTLAQAEIDALFD